MNKPYSSDVAFSDAVKSVQAARGSRTAYARVERQGGFATEIDEQLVDFLADIDTAFLATANAGGQPYVQHRGGPKGFIRALDEHTLGFVDFAGNRQYISTGNLTENDKVCLFLMDYAHKRRVKLWGTAKTVSMTDALREQLGTPGYRAQAEQVVLITLTAWDMNCPQHIPQKVDVAEVAAAVKSLRARITELQEENRQLRARLG